ncbi:AraC family transcriptional regulator [Burkholderia pyrrocinia]|uniref:AraC family transcriptional regulator n=1 Tax=Burkholderia pyrrocinia TaxID=60550 RepID=UPI002AB1D6FF|nr:AraC family transcriptional regulator [Burkholderia pyrrocinia]
MNDTFRHLRELAQKHIQPGECVYLTERLLMFSAVTTSSPLIWLYEPMVCIVIQGAKEVMIGNRVLRYDTSSYFFGSVEVPVTSRITEASASQPFLAVGMILDREIVTEMATGLPEQTKGNVESFSVNPITAELLDACRRVVELFEAPADVPTLAPMIEREIVYRLLQGPQAAMLQQIAREDSRLAQVHRAISWLRLHFDQSASIPHLASLSGMSRATLHRHFVAVTGMSPLQYQKALRLHEARRMVHAGSKISDAAYSVGYQSASQFCREYSRLFGLTPSADSEQTRHMNANRTAHGWPGRRIIPATLARSVRGSQQSHPD